MAVCWQVLSKFQTERIFVEMKKKSLAIGFAFGLMSISLVADVLQAQTPLRKRLDQVFPGAPFGIGIITHPSAALIQPYYKKHHLHPHAYDFLYQSRSYAGVLGQKVDITAARNEYEPFAFILLPKDDPLTTVRIKAGPLVQKNGPGQIDSRHVEIAPMGYRRITNEAAMEGDEDRFLTVPFYLRPDIKKFDVYPGFQHVVWVTVYVPPETPPGSYRGKIMIEVDHFGSMGVTVDLTVRDFTLPKPPSLPVVTSYTDGGATSEEFMNMIDDMAAAHRFSPGRIYNHENAPSVRRVCRRVESGANLVSLMRVSRQHRPFKYDEQGKVVDVTDAERQRLYNKLDEPIAKLKEAGLIDHCFLYGFDEPITEWLPAQEKIHADLKRRYGGITTMMAMHHPLWKEHGQIRNVDWIACKFDLLHPETVDLFHSWGCKVMGYNLSRASIYARAIFWGIYRAKLDGVLHWSLTQQAAWAKRPFPVDDKPAGYDWAPCYPHAAPNNPHAGPDNPVEILKAVAFEAFREGMEDYEYLKLLESAVVQASRLPRVDPKTGRAIVEAQRWLAVPKHISGGTIYQEGPRPMPTNDQLMAARNRIAELIEKLDTVASARR